MGGEHDATSPVHDNRHLVDSDAGLKPAFSVDDIRWVLHRLETRKRPAGSGPLVLIGGQALNVWCDRYRVGNPDLERHGPFTSKDLDFQASRDLIPWCAQQLDGDYSVAHGGDKSSRLNGIVTIQAAPGETLRIDFLSCAYGLSAAEVVNGSAFAHFDFGEVAFDLRLMHPLHCMKSRVKNVMGLPDQYANDHGIRQLKASIVCLRLFVEDMATRDGRRGAELNEHVFKFALHDLDAERLYSAQKIDVFEAASNAECLPEKFRTIRYPQMVKELAKRRG